MICAPAGRRPLSEWERGIGTAESTARTVSCKLLTAKVRSPQRALQDASRNIRRARHVRISGESCASLCSCRCINFWRHPSCGGEKKTPRERTPSNAKIEAATRLQIFLDRANFSPGKLDGHHGNFTWKALALYRISRASSAKDFLRAINNPWRQTTGCLTQDASKRGGVSKRGLTHFNP